MLRRRREDPDTLTEQLEAPAGHTGLPDVHLAQHFQLTGALRSLAAAAAREVVPLSVTGETNLSKIATSIERIPEDVDVPATAARRPSLEECCTTIASLSGALLESSACVRDLPADAMRRARRYWRYQPG